MWARAGGRAGGAFQSVGKYLVRRDLFSSFFILKCDARARTLAHTHAQHLVPVQAQRAITPVAQVGEECAQHPLNSQRPQLQKR